MKLSVETECALSPDVVAPAVARTFVSRTLRLWGCTQLEEVASLLTSELVTNAVLHAATGIALRLSFDGSELRVEVRDGSSELPKTLPINPHSEHGRGLWIIKNLSREWGSIPTPEGKVVWFALSPDKQEAGIGSASASQGVG